MFQSKSWKIPYNREHERSTDLPDRLINHMTMCYLRSGCQLILDTVDDIKLIAESVNSQYWDSNDLVFHETIVSKKRKVTL